MCEPVFLKWWKRGKAKKHTKMNLRFIFRVPSKRDLSWWGYLPGGALAAGEATAILAGAGRTYSVRASSRSKGLLQTVHLQEQWRRRWREEERWQKGQRWLLRRAKGRHEKWHGGGVILKAGAASRTAGGTGAGGTGVAGEASVKSTWTWRCWRGWCRSFYLKKINHNTKYKMGGMFFSHLAATAALCLCC